MGCMTLGKCSPLYIMIWPNFCHLTDSEAQIGKRYDVFYCVIGTMIFLDYHLPSPSVLRWGFYDNATLIQSWAHSESSTAPGRQIWCWLKTAIDSSTPVLVYYICLTIQYCFYNGNKDYGACTVVFVIAIDTNWILSKYNTLALVQKY